MNLVVTDLMQENRWTVSSTAQFGRQVMQALPCFGWDWALTQWANRIRGHERKSVSSCCTSTGTFLPTGSV